MFFNIWNPSCQSRIAVLNIRFSVSIVLLLLPRETRLSILFDVKSARGIPNFLTPRKAQKTSSCWCVMSVAKRSSNKKCYRVIDLAHIIGAVCTCWLSCGLSFALTLMRRNADSMSQQTRNLSISTARWQVRNKAGSLPNNRFEWRQTGRSWKDASLLKSFEITS